MSAACAKLDLPVRCPHGRWQWPASERASLQTGETLTRYWLGEVHHLRVLCDRSSVEIFINHGEGVMSSRYFLTNRPGCDSKVRPHHITNCCAAWWNSGLAAGSKSLWRKNKTRHH
ncbi:GH32 C-terminal domain-containing protein [Enterobacter cloacae subsp. cloacae]|nr:GH32 C-terminal domain-containing protein [Enterobacter cloacae subsp. cloacae]